MGFLVEEAEMTFNQEVFGRTNRKALGLRAERDV